MASVSGSQLAFFAGGQTVNISLTTDGTNAPAAVPGEFNIEVFTTAAGPLTPGYQAAAFIQGAILLAPNEVQAQTLGSTEQLLAGSYTVIDETGGESIQIVGTGTGGSFTQVVGSSGDTITGGAVSGNTQIIDASGTNPNAVAGAMTITGGAGATTVWAGAGDSITGGAGAITVAGNADNNMTVAGGTGNLDTFNFGTGNSVTGATSASATSFIDDNYGGSHNTITGGAGPTTVIAGKSDLIAGGAGSLLVNAMHGTTTITGGAGASTIWGGANESITGGTGALQVAGDAANAVTITGGAGNLLAFNLGAGDSVTGSTAGTTFIDDSYGTSSTNTLTGGAGASTVIAGSGDSINGGAGTLEAPIGSNLTGSETVNLSAAVSGVRDDSSGGAGTNATVMGFGNNASNLVGSATSVNASNQFLGTSSSSGGNTTLTFLDGTKMTLIGVSSVGAIKFTQ